MKKKVFWSVGLLFAGLCAVFLHTFASSPLDPPETFEGLWPEAQPPPEMALFALPTGVTHRSAGFAYRGGSFWDKRDFVMTAVLVKHPKGDLLIDAGFSREIDEQVKSMPLWFRLVTSYQKLEPALDQLQKNAYDTKDLRGIILTHAHWDHTSGLSDFQALPVWVTAEEREFIHRGGFSVRMIRDIPQITYKEYAFSDRPYLGFEKSFDLYEDGSIVIVPAPGHTPGSVIIFLNLPNHKSYALVGDLVWQQEGLTLREERAWLLRLFADSDPQKLREVLLKMAALKKRFPELAIVPAHDPRGYVDIPTIRKY